MVVRGPDTQSGLKLIINSLIETLQQSDPEQKLSFTFTIARQQPLDRVPVADVIDDLKKLLGAVCFFSSEDNFLIDIKAEPVNEVDEQLMDEVRSKVEAAKSLITAAPKKLITQAK